MSTDLSERRVLIPGGTGGVGEGIVRAYLSAGAHVVVPTRTRERADEFSKLLGAAATDHLHLVVHDYTTFTGADHLATEMERNLGGTDDVVAPIGGWWTGRPLHQITETDWQDAFVTLTTAHLAVLRAFLPRLTPQGAYTLTVGESAFTPIPNSGLVSMEQAAVQMMRQVAQAESEARKRVFALVLGPIRTRHLADGDPDWLTAAQVGRAATAISADPGRPGQEIRIRDQAELQNLLG